MYGHRLSPVANEAALRQSYSASAYYKLRELYLSENVTVAMRDDLAVMREASLILICWLIVWWNFRLCVG